ncbi:MAG: GNAT family N-acetyltransferase [Candidatus Krumholzibacteria bacterium]|nr:GNAT family N-acetyltransferase [Candidatus Krumholzibacteria bacterium]MDH4338266.1 GNAT family N-acetyltransferase [Candidatus Krumholzibacteria bacterium]MDH5271064.1 GNAT family N-acetyltransferase [Candidatus Krumholzibacteria bacterium]
MNVIQLEPDDTETVVDVLCDAFHDYPVMRYVLGDTPHYDRHLRTLVGFFAAARSLRNEPMLAAEDEGQVVGVAIMTLPGERPSPAALDARREATWGEIGPAARTRYEAHGAATRPFTVDRPHHHLNMIGVCRSHAGRGVARVLMDAVHELAAADPSSCGVTLSTEDEQNVRLYEHFGYQLIGHARVADAFDTWVFFRPRQQQKG